MTKPILETDFKPAVMKLRNFFKDVEKYSNKQHLIVSIERANGFISSKVFPEYSNMDIGMLSDFMRRLGQSIATASLPELK